METTTHIGANRTGIKASSFDARSLLGTVEPAAQPPEPTSTPLATLRLDYIRQADALGSVPPPATVRGALGVGKDAITGKRPQVIFDRIAERLAFERSGVRLYEGILLKHQADPDAAGTVPLAQLQEFHDQELQHFKLLVEAMEQLGGDPTSQTPAAAVTGIAGMGLVKLVSEPRANFQQSLQALLIAELADGDGWKALIDVMEHSGHADLALRFAQAAAEEERHLERVRHWTLELTRAELGAQ